MDAFDEIKKITDKNQFKLSNILQKSCGKSAEYLIQQEQNKEWKREHKDLYKKAPEDRHRNH